MSTTESTDSFPDPQSLPEAHVDPAPIDPATPDPTPLNPAPVAPLAPTERWPTMDVLRGVAILGILPVNIYSFGLPESAIINPALFDAGAMLDRVARWTTHLLAEMRFISIFTMLFGLGVWISAERAAGAGAASRHYRRMLALLGFGLIHAYVFWYGDVLVLYALCGMIVFLVRRWNPRWLLALGIGGIVLTAVIALAFAAIYVAAPAEDRTEMDSSLTYSEDDVASEIAAYRGSWADQNVFRWETAMWMQTAGLFWFGPQTLGLMLIGIALGRAGLFWGNWSISKGLMLAALLIASGIALTLVGRSNAGAYHDQVMLQIVLGGLPNMIGAPMSAVGYAIVVVSVVRTTQPNAILHTLAMLGRTALSNYLLQTLLCTTLFYGHGFGRFASFSPAQLVGVVISVWAIQIALTRYWCARYDIGLAEWLWRLVSYGRAPVWHRAGA
jgi:uncharacterized protein